MAEELYEEIEVPVRENGDDAEASAEAGENLRAT